MVGKNIEDENFWDGVAIDPVSFDSDWLEEASLILRPASTDFKPRLIMRALSAGIPVIASPWCGLPSQEGLHFVSGSDPDELAEKIRRLI
jgi:glycosyltransferase involved in cell wall biosynthesis